MPIGSCDTKDLDNRRFAFEGQSIIEPAMINEINNIKAELARRQVIKSDDREVLEQKVIEDLKCRHDIKSLNEKDLKKAFNTACDNFWDSGWNLNEEKSKEKKLLATDIDNLNRLIIFAIDENKCEQQITDKNSKKLKDLKNQRKELIVQRYQFGTADPTTEEVRKQKKLIKKELLTVSDKISSLEKKVKRRKLRQEINRMHNNSDIQNDLSVRINQMQWNLRTRE